jgi:protein involved in polysaccharide export with SLBB domain
VTPDYVIGPGDEIRIRVWGQVNFNADLKVDRSGDVYLPQVGRIHVTGIQFSDLSQQIRSQIGRVFRNFDLTVDLGQLRSIQIFVVGQARRPGAYTVSSLSTLVNALFASGGPSVQGSMRDIQLKREGKVITHFDLYDLLVRGDKSKDSRLLPGDVIFIPAVASQVALTGSVRRPAIYELNAGDTATTIQQVLDAAGGLSSVAANSRVAVERIEDHQARQAMEVALDATGLATPLRDGDVVRVLSIVPAFDKTVTIRGNLANPGRFAWHDGMKLSELIPDRPSLITRNYWWRRAQLGLPGPEFQPLEGRNLRGQPAAPVTLPPMRRLPRETTPGTNPANSTNPQSQAAEQNSNTQFSDDLSDPTQGQQPGDNSTGTQRTAPLAAQSEAAGSTLAGQQNEVVTQNTAAAGPRLDVTLSAPEIYWSYAVIERLDSVTLKTSLLPFNLGKLVIDHDPSQDLVLQPGDVVSIFSQADIKVPLDQQTKFVRLDGEFASSGIYSVQPGETLRDLVRRAGGFAPGAYLFGSEFTRESTRVFQQQRLDEYVQTLELQIPRQGLALAASAVSPQDAVAANSANISQQALLSKLHQLKASGRIVLEVKPNSVGLDSIPDLQLQDGDHFTVPPIPASVNVVGAVYDQNSFLFQFDRRVGDYLRLAGGPNRDADKSHIFVIRADGSVFSRESANGLWGNNFEATRLNPGDSIVVPEKVIGSSVLRGFVNWSQVFSQLALGAAAISVLHN